MSEGIGRRGFLNGLAAIAAGTALNACSGLPSRIDCLAKAKEYLANDDYVHAIRWLDDLLEQDNRNHEAFSDRGWAYFKLSQNTQAIEDQTRAIELKGSVAGYYTKRGFAYYVRSMQGGPRLADTQGALDDLQKAVMLDDNLADAHAGLGFVYALIKKKPEAYAAFKKAKQLLSAGRPLEYVEDARVEDAYWQLKRELNIKDDA